MRSVFGRQKLNSLEALKLGNWLTDVSQTVYLVAYAMAAHLGKEVVDGILAEFHKTADALLEQLSSAGAETYDRLAQERLEESEITLLANIIHVVRAGEQLDCADAKLSLTKRYRATAVGPFSWRTIADANFLTAGLSEPDTQRVINLTLKETKTGIAVRRPITPSSGHSKLLHWTGWYWLNRAPVSRLSSHFWVRSPTTSANRVRTSGRTRKRRIWRRFIPAKSQKGGARFQWRVSARQKNLVFPV